MPGLRNNMEIRVLMYQSGIRQWQLAEQLGISESKLSRSLRHQMSKQETDEVLNALAVLVAKLSKESAIEYMSGYTQENGG